MNNSGCEIFPSADFQPFLPVLTIVAGILTLKTDFHSIAGSNTQGIFGVYLKLRFEIKALAQCLICF